MTPRFITKEQFSAMEQAVKGNRVRGTANCNRQDGGHVGATGVTAVLKVDPSRPSPSKYRSKWEAAYASKLELEKRAGHIINYWYEPFSLWLPGKVRYKPDFMVQNMPDLSPNELPIELIEVKGWSKNRRDGITRLKIAAALFPCFVWRMVWMKKGGGFDGEYV